MRHVLRLAAGYNGAWGLFAIAAPERGFDLLGLETPRYPELWQCLGMVIGVYGIGYALAARDPLRHWPIVLVGLVGKVLGPVGFVHAALAGRLPWRFGWLVVANDLAWWIPFGLILLAARRHHRPAG